MRVTGFWALAGLAVMGIIVADLAIHPTGVRAAGAVVSSLEKNTDNQLLGSRA